jgi:NAD-dependent SIR2 family protein deacetylase
MKKSEEILHKHIDKESMDELSENVWTDMIDAMEEYANMRVEKNSVSQHVGQRAAPCYNCGETVDECACMRNKCIRCGRPVGNITFTICDECWDKEHSK